MDGLILHEPDYWHTVWQFIAFAACMVIVLLLRKM
jgi:hypothetical protein